MRVTIRTSLGRTFEASVELHWSVREFKEQIAAEAEVAASEQRLICKGRAMKDDLLLEEYGLEDNGTVHLVRAVSASAQQQQQPQRGVAFPPQQQQQQTFPRGAPPTSDLLGDPAALQRRLLADPEAMQAALNSPLTRQLMDSPDALRTLIESNPRLRSVLDANPQLRHALSDPNVLRDAMEVARSPARLREAMRHQDLAMSQLENHPEGFNALRRTYEQVQEPLLDADFLGSGATTSSSTTPTRSPPPNAPAGALANPWAPQPPQAPAAGGAALLQALQRQGGGFPLPDPALLQALSGASGQQLPDPAMLQALIGGNGDLAATRNAASVQPRAEVPPNPWADIPAASFDDQHQQLVDMGFADRAANQRALAATNGDVSAAINWLLSHDDQDDNSS